MVTNILVHDFSVIDLENKNVHVIFFQNGSERRIIFKKNTVELSVFNDIRGKYKEKPSSADVQEMVNTSRKYISFEAYCNKSIFRTNIKELSHE